jgi:hypothetical protein
VILTRRGRAAVVVVAAGILLVLPGDPALPNDGTPAACEVVQFAEDVDGTGASDAVVADLIAAGYRGDPTDGREALYSPACGR